MPEVWVPGAAEPSLDDFVQRIHRQIETYTEQHASERSVAEVELAGGERFPLRAISGEPGYGFLTLCAHPGDEVEFDQLIVPVGAIRRISLSPAEAERATFGFALPASRKE